MIIKRKYVKFRELLNDPKSKEIIDEAWKCFDGIENPERWDFILDERIIDKRMEWAIPNVEKFIPVIEEGFEKLDKECPYDNGYTYKDVNGVRIEESDDNTIHLMLTKTFFDRQTYDPSETDDIASIVIKNNKIVEDEEINNIKIDY